MSSKENEIETIFKFRVNDELISLCERDDGSDHLFKLSSDDTYAVQYIRELITTGFITLDEPLSYIFRIDEDDTEMLIYSQLEKNDYVPSPVSEDQKTNGPSKEISIWTDEETRMLLDLYEDFLSKIGPQKKFKTKKLMWGKVAEMVTQTFGNQKTAIQCENRYKTVLKRKKIAVDNNNKSGNSRATIPFEEELNKIASLDDSIEPEVLGSIHNIKVLKHVTLTPVTQETRHLKPIMENEGRASPSQLDCTKVEGNKKRSVSESSTTATPTKKQRNISIHETLWKIHEDKEESKERRHREKLQLIRELFGN